MVNDIMKKVETNLVSILLKLFLNQTIIYSKGSSAAQI